jgi:hypothetical protein
MLFEEALFKYLSTYAALSAYVDKKIYPLAIPEDKKSPAIAYQQISSRNIDSLQTSSDAGYFNYQLSIYANTYTEAKNIAKVLKTALKDYTGIMGGSGGVNIGATHKIGDDIDGQDEETKEYSVKQEYSFFFEK